MSGLYIHNSLVLNVFLQFYYIRRRKEHLKERFNNSPHDVIDFLWNSINHLVAFPISEKGSNLIHIDSCKITSVEKMLDTLKNYSDSH